MHRSFTWKASIAAEHMKLGGVIAYPTEAVWGLGCDPTNETAVTRLLALKKRPIEKGLILISGQTEHFEPLLAPLDAELRQRFLEASDRPTTWLVPDVAGLVPYWVKGEHRSVALRLTKHPFSVALSKKMGGLLVSTSANPSTKPAAESLYDVRRYFANRLDCVVQAKLGGATQVSQIKDLVSGSVLRT